MSVLTFQFDEKPVVPQ